MSCRGRTIGLTGISLCALLALAVANVVGAAEGDELAKQAKTELRGVQGAIFNGKIDEASERLSKAVGSIKALKLANAGHRDLQKIEADADKMKKDLDRRTKKPAEPTAPGRTAAGPAVPAAATSAKLPYGARRPMDELQGLHRSIENALKWVETYRQSGEDVQKIKQKLGDARELVTQIDTTLANAKAEAAKQGVTEHPDFAAAEAKIAEVKAKLPELERAALEQSTTAAAGKDAVQKDCDALVAAFETAREEYFNKASGGAIYYNSLEPVQECLAVVKKFEQEARGKLQGLLGEFSAKYGKSEEEIDKKVDALGYQGNWRAGAAYKQIAEGIEKVAKTRVAMCEDLVAKAVEKLDGLSAMHDFAREERRGTVKAYAAMASEFDTGNAKLKEFQAALTKTLDADLAALDKKIDGREWKPTKNGFDKEADAGMKYLRESEDWAKRAQKPYAILAVSVLGDWTVQEKDALGRPLSYGVPAWIAVQLAEDKPLNRGRVFSIYFRTREGLDVKQVPPFASITVGDSWYIRPATVK